MGRRQVFDMDVVADAGAVRGGVVRAHDWNPVAFSGRGPQDQRNEMSLGVVALAARSGGAARIEVP